MRKALFVLILLAVQASSQGDEPIPLSGVESNQQNEIGESQPNLASTPGTSQSLERLLMGLLAVAAIGFQLRRKYKASQRVWQRIDSTESEPPRLEPLQERFQISSAVRWQQTQ